MSYPLYLLSPYIYSPLTVSWSCPSSTLTSYPTCLSTHSPAPICRLRKYQYRSLVLLPTTMANDQAKSPGSVAQEHPYPPGMPPYAQPLGAYPSGYPIYYAQPPDSSHGENTNGATPGPQFMIPFPAAPGMMYPYPPHPPGQGAQYFFRPPTPLTSEKIGFPQYPQSTPATGNGQRPKRKQVKMAVSR